MYRAPTWPRRIGDTCRQVTDIWRSSWVERRSRELPPALNYELQFSPAHIELTETPVHPAPLWTSRMLVAIILLVVLCVILGRLDIVAVAPGELIPNDNVKLVQPALTAVVRRILVANGDRVSKGQPLLELDPSQATADVTLAQDAKIESQLASARARAVLDAQSTGVAPDVALVTGASSDRQAGAQQFAVSVFREYHDHLLSLRAELTRRQAEYDTSQIEIAKLKLTSPIAQRQADDYRELAQDHFVAAHEALDKQQIAVEQSQELAAQQSHARALSAAVEEQHRILDTEIATFRRQQLEAIDAADQATTQRQQETAKATARRDFLHLTSPVDGVVQQLNVHTVGGVVTAAQPVMEIVPNDALEVEAHISNKDIGFINVGQAVTIKVATFPYARFGFLRGQVVKVANDATLDKRLGLVFLARIRLTTGRFRVRNKWVNLSPGMEVSAEIATGKQSVWQYFLTPLVEASHESLTER